jgi:hypothetical protein
MVQKEGESHLVLKSGPRKPRLDTIGLEQWSIANLAILYQLMADGKIQNASVIDYLSYTAKIYQLCQRFEQSSVWFYDREYRRLQAQHGFCWGTDVATFIKCILFQSHITGRRIPGRKIRSPVPTPLGVDSNLGTQSQNQ